MFAIIRPLIQQVQVDSIEVTSPRHIRFSIRKAPYAILLKY